MSKRLIRGALVSVNVLEDLGAKEKVEVICERCGGTGVATQYSYHDNGFCYKCMGSGVSKIINIKKRSEAEIRAELLDKIVEVRRSKRLITEDELVEKWRRDETLESLLNILNRNKSIRRY